MVICSMLHASLPLEAVHVWTNGCRWHGDMHRKGQMFAFGTCTECRKLHHHPSVALGMPSVTSLH
jgi:hypothetical protein